MNLAFKVLFLAHAPDAEPGKHKCKVETSMYSLHVRVVRNQAQAVEVSRDLVKEEGIHSILLCPGFRHADVAEIAKEVGKDVGVFVARGDGPSSRATKEIMTREGYFSEKAKD